MAQVVKTLVAVEPVDTMASMAAPQEAVAGVAGFDLQVTPAPVNPSDPAVLQAASVDDPLVAAVDNPEPGTLVLLSIGSLLVLLSQIRRGKRIL